jgi:dolichol-phosphate mannosyltransferase
MAVLESDELLDLRTLHTWQPRGHTMLLSLVIPCHNEEESFPLLVARLRPVLDSLHESYEVIVVDDGSRDATKAVLLHEQASWPELKVRLLAANVGHQSALTAGLDAASGDYVITMDADLQDPPELIPTMLARARESDLDVVYAARADRSSDSWFKRTTAGLYYRLMRRYAGVQLPPHVGDYRLMSARVVDVLRSLPERNRVYRLLIPWLGFPSATVEYTREARSAGETKYSLIKMINLSVDSTTSFTTAPLRIATGLGLATAFFSLLAAIATILTWSLGSTVPGWASLTVVVLFLGAVQLLCVGVLGEYLGRVYQEVQRRPLYTVFADITGKSREVSSTEVNARGA